VFEVRTLLESSDLRSQTKLVTGILLSPYEPVTPSNIEEVDGYAGVREFQESELFASCMDIVGRTLSPKLAARYKLATLLPVSYRLSPGWLRSKVLRGSMDDSETEAHSTLELAREELVRLFRDSGHDLKEKRRPMLVVTHDIDNEEGFRRAVAMKSIDDELGLKSIWFIPSDQYHFDQQGVRDLACNSFIGSHDTMHDGKLIQIGDKTRLAQRLRKSKERLENVFSNDVRCFRAPLLQFSRTILKGVKEAGYAFDFSLPSWEPAHPSVMGPFGLEYFHGFNLEGVAEVPLTLLQDHQALFVMGLSPKEAIYQWKRQAEFVLSVGGDLVLLVHPDYWSSNELEAYKELLTTLIGYGASNLEDLSALMSGPRPGQNPSTSDPHSSTSWAR
jgi:hypothetical protein